MSRRQRPSWSQYFLDIAKAVAARSTCPRARVGAVIVKDNRILATGYNGALAGEPHCIEAGCLMEGKHCLRAVHAEANAIAQAAKFGAPIDGATIYHWDSLHRGSCTKCSQVTKAAGIARAVYNEK